MALTYDVRISRAGVAIEHNGQSPWNGGYVRKPLDFRRGRNYGSQQLGRSQAGRLSMTLYNDNSEWNIIKARDTIQVVAIRNGVEESAWTGFVDDVNQKFVSPGRKLLIVRGLGNLALMTRNTITEYPRFNVDIPEAMELVFQRSGIIPALRGSIDSSVTMDAWWAQNIECLDAAFELEITSRGFLNEARDGRIALDSLESRVNRATGKTLPNIWDFNIDSAQQRLNVAFEGSIRYLGLTPEDALWSIDTQSPYLPLIIAPGVTETIQAVVPTSNAQTGILAVNSITPFEITDYLATGILNITATINTAGVLFSITNNNLADTTLLQLQVRGTALIEQDGELIQRAAGTIDINTEFTEIPSHFFSSPGELRSMFSFLIGLGETGQTIATMKWFADDDEAVAHTLDLSDRIDRPNGFAANFFIEGLHHRIWQGGRHEINLTMSTTTPYDGLFVLGESLLGSTAKLA